MVVYSVSATGLCKSDVWLAPAVFKMWSSFRRRSDCLSLCLVRYSICTVLARCHIIEVKHSNNKNKEDLIMCWSGLFYYYMLWWVIMLDVKKRMHKAQLGFYFQTFVLVFPTRQQRELFHQWTKLRKTLTAHCLFLASSLLVREFITDFIICFHQFYLFSNSQTALRDTLIKTSSLNI